MLLVLGGRRARRAPDEEHPFGYGRERYFWAFLVAVVLFTVGGAFSLYEGIEKLRHPHELESPQWAIGILLVAIVLESFSLRTAVIESNHTRGKKSWWGFIRHSKSPELPVVLLEDTGALLGLAFALAGVGLAVITGESRFDALGSVAIGVLLCVIAVVVEMDGSLTFFEVAEAVEDAERRIRAAVPAARVIYIEPDVLRTAEKPPTRGATKSS